MAASPPAAAALVDAHVVPGLAKNGGSMLLAGDDGLSLSDICRRRHPSQIATFAVGVGGLGMRLRSRQTPDSARY